MTTERPTYLQRDRADSFGAVADAYDRYRPSYPTRLIDDLVARVANRSAQVLDVGCGTGKAARMLTARGLTVLGVEPDARMAEVARRHGLRVEVAGFEDWDERGRQFGLITSGQAWHWVDPARAASKAARLLVAGGTLAVFWNYGSLDDETRAVVDDVYRQHAPQLHSALAGNQRRDDLDSHIADLKAYGGFTDVTTRTYPWEWVDPVAHAVARVGTHSDHLLLGPARLRELQDALTTALSERGDTVRSVGGTYTILARSD